MTRYALLAASIVLMANGAIAEEYSPYSATPYSTPEQVAPATGGYDVYGQAQQTQYYGAPQQTAPVSFQPATQGPEPTAQEYFAIDQLQGDTGKYSGKKYQAVTYTLKNTQPFHLELLQAEVPGALDESTVAQKKSKAGLGLKMAGMGLGIASSFIPYAGGVGSIAAMQAVHAGAAVASAASSAIASTPTGDLQITGQFVQRVNNVMLNPNQTFTFTALLPKDATPALNLMFKNLETNRIYDLAK